MKTPGKGALSRREMLKYLGITIGSASLASCAPLATPTVQQAAPTQPSAAPQQEPTLAPAAVGSNLTLWYGEYDEAIMQQAFDRFKENTGNTIDWLNVPEFWVKIPAAAASGDLPDIIIMGDTDIPTFAVKNVLLPLDKYAAAVDMSDFRPSALEHSSWGGHLYGIPFENGPSMWVYNKALVREAGVDDPWELAKKGQWTQAAFDTIIKAITKGEGATAQWGTFEPSKSLDIQAPFIQGFGGKVFNDDFTKLTVNSPEAVAAWEYILNQKWDGYAADPSDSVAGHTGILPLFNAGKVGFVYFPRGLWPALNADLELGLAPPFLFEVAGKAFTRHGVNIFSVNANAKNPDACWDFVHFFGTEGNDILVQNQSGTPNRRSALDSTAWNEVLKAGGGWEDPEAWKMGFDALIPTLAPPGFYEINDMVQAAYDAAFLKTKTIQEAMDEAVEAANKVLAEQQG